MIGGLSRTSRVKRVNMESSLFLANDVIFRELWNSKSNYRDLPSLIAVNCAHDTPLRPLITPRKITTTSLKHLEKRDHNMFPISEIREVNEPQRPPGILFSTVPLYNRDETKCVIIPLKKLMLCSLEFSIELISILTHRLPDCGPTS